jgi:transcriptional regulator with XRE-family HTH domain
MLQTLTMTTRAPADAPHASGLSRRMRLAREHAGLSQRALALKARCTNSTIIEVEAGKRMPQIDTIEVLARALGVTAGWLAYGEGIAQEWANETETGSAST